MLGTWFLLSPLARAIPVSSNLNMMDDPSQHPPASLHPSTASAAQQGLTQASGANGASPASAAGAPQAAGSQPKRYRPAPAKTFQCRGFGECRMVFSRSEHLARHIRSAYALSSSEPAQSILKPSKPFFPYLCAGTGSTPANAPSPVTVENSSRDSITFASMLRRSTQTSTPKTRS